MILSKIRYLLKNPKGIVQFNSKNTPFLLYCLETWLQNIRGFEASCSIVLSIYIGRCLNWSNIGSDKGLSSLLRVFSNSTISPVSSYILSFNHAVGSIILFLTLLQKNEKF